MQQIKWRSLEPISWI